MLQTIHDGLWVQHVPYRAMGFPIGRQIVVVRLANGGLWILSPIPVTPELRTNLAELGEIRHVIGPNRYHDECLEEFQRNYPKAIFHAAPGLAEIKKSVRFGAKITELPHPEWTGVLDQHLIRGMPKLNETVFLHRASRSLLIADIAFNLGPEGPWWFAWLMRLNNGWGRFGPTHYCKSMIQDRSAVRASIDRILEWDFDRILVGHGRNLESGGKDALRAAFAFLG